MSEKNWVPEIMYENSDGGLTSNIPFVAVPADEDMPSILYIFESRETGEVEPGENGEELPIVEMDLHQYADMNILKEGLDTDVYDKIRQCLGLKPMHEAVPEGREISQKVRENL
tara:strand:+ start:409 stop:750 length:342 start_codon:yes stop_codon:yes gene_type:complete